jgi:hypothetical protein
MNQQNVVVLRRLGGFLGSTAFGAANHPDIYERYPSREAAVAAGLKMDRVTLNSVLGLYDAASGRQIMDGRAYMAAVEHLRPSRVRPLGI